MEAVYERVSLQEGIAASHVQIPSAVKAQTILNYKNKNFYLVLLTYLNLMSYINTYTYIYYKIYI